MERFEIDAKTIVRGGGVSWRNGYDWGRLDLHVLPIVVQWGGDAVYPGA